MAYVAGYDYDIFISYSPLDNTPISNEPHGWVDIFYRDLKMLLGQMIGDQRWPTIWWNDSWLGHVVFDPATANAIEKSAILICLTSPSFISSEFCRHELRIFNEAAKNNALKFNNRSRIINVLLYNIPYVDWPGELLGNKRFKFNDSPVVTDLGNPLSPDDRAYSEALRDLTHEITSIWNAVALHRRPNQSEAASGIPSSVEFDAQESSVSKITSEADVSVNKLPDNSNPVYDVFLSYNREDSAEVEDIARELQSKDIKVFLDQWYLALGIPWQQKLEQILSTCRSVIVFVGPKGTGNWQVREKEIALDRQTKNKDFPVIPVILPGADPPLGFLSNNTWADLRNGVHEDILDLLASAIRGGHVGPQLDAKVESICPYRDLRYFREEDAPFFFGRDALINRLEDVVNKKSLVAVVGASGSGKSSVVRAGLLPRLRSVKNKTVWNMGIMVPGDRPFQNLAAVFVPLLEPRMSQVERLEQVGKLAAGLLDDNIKLRDVVDTTLKNDTGTDRFLLVVDQWEEVYTHIKDATHRTKFFQQILDATRHGNLQVVLTIRSDFYDQLIGDHAFADPLQDAQVNISSMKPEELRQVIEEPAKKVGLRFEMGLVNRILDHVQSQPDSLPLLEFVLTELWRYKSGQLLTHKSYETIGELRGAIATHAEKVFTNLPQQEQLIAKRIFLQLVRPGIVTTGDDNETEIEPTRRRIFFDELHAESIPVVRKLANSRLIVTGRHEATNKEMIDLVHEALLKAWDRLKQWIVDEKDFLVWRDQLRSLMNIFGTGKRKKSKLLTGDLLTEAKKWYKQKKDELSPQEQLYIEQSVQSKNRMFTGAIVVGVVLIVAVTLYLLGNIGGSAQRGDDGPVDTTHITDKGTDATSFMFPMEKNLPPLSSIRFPDTVTTIPVVVHVIYSTDSENISDAQIKSQIAVLNEDFRAKNKDLTNVPGVFKDLIGDAHIEFQLATTDPNGKPTKGITRTKTDIAEFKFDNRMFSKAEGGADSWPAQYYLNIWVCDMPDILSFTSLDTSIADGIVVHYKAFGTIGAATIYKDGRNATHEIGHFFCLHHIWGDRDCGDDGIPDTPPQREASTGSPLFPHITCNNGPNGDLFVNFMDYSDKVCMFTKGQVMRMHQVLQGPRATLRVKKAG